MKNFDQFNESKINDEEVDFRNVNNAFNDYKKELRSIIVENNPDFTDMEINVLFDDYKEDIEECFSNDTDVYDCYDDIIVNYQ